MLDRPTDRLCRGGAPVENLTHRASFHAREKTAPSNPRIKHLAPLRTVEIDLGDASAFPDERAYELLDLAPGGGDTYTILLCHGGTTPPENDAEQEW